MRISSATALDIASAWREIEIAEKLLADVQKAIQEQRPSDIRDGFGRRRDLQLGIPSGDNGHRLFGVQWSLAAPIIEAHLAHQKALLLVLSEKARTELDDPAS